MAISSRGNYRFLLLILCSISRHVRSSEKSYPGAIYTKLNSRLRGYTFKSCVTPSQVSCSQACLFNARCSSTNFKEISRQHKGLCELNDAPSLDVIGLENDLHHEDGFIFALFPNDNMEDCRWRGCHNNGVCVAKMQSFVCYCKVPWTGSSCEIKISLYNFTTLGATGRDGPDNNTAGYIGTGLQNIQVKDGKQEWIVPFAGTFRVEACGASGGSGFTGIEGGRGAKVSGNVSLTKGEKIIVLVGQKGSSQYGSHPGSGGGGTFVISQVGPILVAGGGGGGAAKNGSPGNYKQNGSGIGAGSNGLGGLVCKQSGSDARPPNSGSGAGINGSGGCLDVLQSCARNICEKGGKSFTEGGEGGEEPNCHGGFGGGGACAVYGPGGGGGYSGGGVDHNIAGGGGGSFVGDVTWSVIKGGCDEGDGYVSFISED